MPHLIKSFPSSNFSNPNFSSPVSFDEALRELRKAHEYLIKRSHNGIKSTISIPTAEWGIRQKRSIVNLRPRESRPDLIEKDDEKLVEVINIAATLERLMDAIEWFAADPSSRDYKISECHPSTSDAKKKEPNSASNSTSNDLVLVNGCGKP